MLYILSTIIVSFIIIILIHYLWNLFKDTYSTKKTRDLVGSQTRKYQIIIDELLKNKTQDKRFLSDEDTKFLTDDLSLFIDDQLSELRI